MPDRKKCPSLKDFKVLTFDCYGTLIDWETGISRGLEPLTSRAEIAVSTDELLEMHARLEAAQQSATPSMPYERLLAVVYKRLAEEWRIPASWAECLEYGKSIGIWPPFNDSASALEYLNKHYRLVVLSNVDNASFEASREKLGIQFDAVYTAEDIGSYKPERRNFEYMFDQLARHDVRRSEILHVAESMFHDHETARATGLSNCWIHRRCGKIGFGAASKPKHTPEIDFTFPSLAAFVEAHRSELN